ncbi:MAG TPA: cupin domain-containing protein [bacterium]|nr:cupin domain-containing protein [bacterium]
MAAEYVFTSLNALPGKEIAKGVTMRPLAGAHVMISCVDLSPDSTVALHSHPHEQLGVVLEGQIEMQIGEERRALRPGDAYVIPGGTRHAARASGGPARVLDVFYPLREEYLRG